LDCFFVFSPQGEMCITGGCLPTKGRQSFAEGLSPNDCVGDS
jgi:hypothetical protein